MIIGILSDAHGNAIGFKKCLNYLRKYSDRIYFLGDAVGYFPFPNEIIDELRQDEKIFSILGNHDAMLLGLLSYTQDKEDVYLIKKTKEKITDLNLNFLSGLLPFRTLEVDNQLILFSHGNPQDPLKGYIYPDSPIENLSRIGYDLLFMGHTHRSFIKQVNNKTIVNVGSCGFCRDAGNIVTVVLYDTKSLKVKLVEIELDVNEVLSCYGNFIHDSVKKVLKRNNKNIEKE